MRDTITLFKEKTECCGCSACVATCPQNAIVMKKDENGFLYPIIKSDKCIACELCLHVCGMRKVRELSETIFSCAAQSKNEEILKKSASGGIFSSIAQNVLQKGGIVAGCTLENTNNKLVPKHILIYSENELNKLQGSKYVQSDMLEVYEKIKKELDKGITVLFSGTPCQVDALKCFLKKIYINLFTIDIICHGVANDSLFNDYIDNIQRKSHAKIIDFQFRNKELNSGMNRKFVLKYILKKKNGNIITRYFLATRSVYYRMFLNGEIYRDSCYTCPYANLNRVGDITIGDYWGIEKEHPKYLKQNGGILDLEKGISCVLINTQKGQKLFQETEDKINFLISDKTKIAKWNQQLRQPSHVNKNREQILKIYKQFGYPLLEKWYYFHLLKNKIIQKIKSFDNIKSFNPKRRKNL